MYLTPPGPMTPWMRLAVRAAAKEGAGSETGVLRALSNLSGTHRAWVPTDFEVQEHIVAKQRGKEIHFPRPLHRENHRTILRGYLESLHGKYQKDGFCTVGKGDIVVDCGAYVGGFARSVAPIAGRIVVIEPAPVNYSCCVQNLKDFAFATAIQMGLFNKSGTFELRMSRSDVDHSLLAPDHGATGEVIEVPIRRLDDLVEEIGLDRIDFFKLEAEGAEIEAIEGMGDIRPKKIAIDVSPERYGESPADQLTVTLQGYGYEVRTYGHTLLAVLSR